MTTPGTLTDRYVDAAVRRLPERQRPDIERELRTAIADAVDDKVEAGGDPAEAEVAVLTELGDPARLAAGYADRTLHLIGPAVYLDYLRFLQVLLVLVVPAVAGAVGLVRALDGGPVSAIIGGVIGTAITAGLHVVFWTTLLFAAIERTPAARRKTLREWTPDQLPEQPSRRARNGELIAETALTVVFGALILLSPNLKLATDEAGEPVGFLHPWLWDTGVIYVFLGLVVLNLGSSFSKYFARQNVPLALAGAFVEIASALTMIWLASTDRIVNPAFITAADWSPEAGEWIHTGLVILAAFSILGAVVTAVRRLTGR
jgi:hypothetical protein